MRSTVRIDDDLMQQLKERAAREQLSLSRMLNRTLRDGLRAGRAARATTKRYREQCYSMGETSINLDQAVALAAQLDDSELERKLQLRK